MSNKVSLRLEIGDGMQREEKIRTNLMWNGGLTEKLIITQLVMKLPAFYGTRNSLPCSQEPATSPYPESHKSSPHIPTLLSSDPF
jgi:hypothetical protein